MSASTDVRLVAGLAALLSSFAVGCGPDFDHLDFQNRNTPPGIADVDFNSVTIHAGLAIGVVATPIEDDGEEMDEDTVVELTSNNENVLRVDPSLENHTFVIYGVTPGTADINVRIDGDQLAIIPSTVIRQEP